MNDQHDPRRWLIGPLAPYASCVVLESDGAVELPAASLLTPDGATAALAAFAARHPGAPKRALVSQWLKRYLAALLIPQVGLLLMARWRLPQALDGLMLRQNDAGEVVAFRYPDPGAPQIADASPEQRWQTLLFAHLDPLIAALAAYGRISQRVLWNNVGNLLESIFAELGKRQRGEDPFAPDRYLLIETAQWITPDGGQRRNPMRDPVHYAPPLMPEHSTEPTRLRRHCCLRHEIPGVVYCATCPHLTDLEPPALQALLERWHHED